MNHIEEIRVIISGVCLLAGVDPVTSVWCFVIVELLGSMLRLVLLKRQADIDVWHFVVHVLCRVMVPVAVMAAISYLCVTLIHHPYRLVITLLLSMSGGAVMIWLTALSKEEKNILYTMLKLK